MKKNKHWWPSLQIRNSLTLLILAAILIQVSGAVQYYFARNGIRNEVEHHAKTEMMVKHLEIQQMVSGVESAVENVRWLLEWTVDNPETIYPILEEFVKSNPDICGCAFAFEPNHFEDMGRWYEPYVLRDANGLLIQKQIADSLHDYHQMNWYKEGLVAESGRWTEPYIDNEGAHGMVCTYTIPVHNEAGDPVAVFAADLSLNWLTEKFTMKEDAKEVSFLVSREGQLLACPDKDRIMKYSLEDIKAINDDTQIEAINKDMLAGHEGSAKVKDNNGDTRIIYYSPVGGRTGWQFTSQSVTLTPGQTLFIYTDGLTEAENATHEQFGEERMMEVLAKSDTAPRPLIENIIKEVHHFVGQAEQSDDLTMLAVQFRKARASVPSHVISNSIILHNDVQEVPMMTEFVEKTAEQANLDPSVTMSLTLAIEEAVANIMKYAYPEGEVGPIEINAIINDGSLSFTIKDSGTPFDPTQVKKADITLSAEDREIGGLGIHLIRNIMDTVEYHHTSDQNILTLTKNIE